MKRYRLVLVIAPLSVLLSCGAKNTNNVEPEVKQISYQEALNYFIDTTTKEVKATIPNYNTLGLSGGVDGFLLMKVFKNLRASDFRNVTTHHGDYLIKNDTLYFSGHAASNSAVLGMKGMDTLLRNCSSRLTLAVTSKPGINQLITALRGH